MVQQLINWLQPYKAGARPVSRLMAGLLWVHCQHSAKPSNRHFTLPVNQIRQFWRGVEVWL